MTDDVVASRRGVSVSKQNHAVVPLIVKVSLWVRIGPSIDQLRFRFR